MRHADPIESAHSARDLERSGLGAFVIDYGPESALLWVVFMDADGACWTVPNFEVRISYNWTLGRRKAGDTSTAPTASPDTPVRFPRPA